MLISREKILSYLLLGEMKEAERPRLEADAIGMRSGWGRGRRGQELHQESEMCLYNFMCSSLERENSLLPSTVRDEGGGSAPGWRGTQPARGAVGDEAGAVRSNTRNLKCVSITSCAHL